MKNSNNHPKSGIKYLRYYFFKFSICIGITLVLISCKQEITEENDNYAEIPAPITFSPEIPHDVDPALQKLLKSEGKIYELNQAFNKYSWQAFVAINWPVDSLGTPLPNFTDKGTPSWMNWKESFEVYRQDGKKPTGWDSPRTVLEIVDGMVPIPPEAHQSNTTRIISSKGTPTHGGNINIVDEEGQAFSGPLYDQNGNIIRYEILLNKEEFDYIMDNSLYNINGQIEFSSQPGFTAVNFPSGEYGGKNEGAIEIKLAWKILESTDYKDRYFTSQGYVINNKTGKWEIKDLGLIGFHISQKTKTGKQWVWSTFEHIDNLREHNIEKNGETIRIKPTLTDPDCELCPVNTRIDLLVDGVRTTKYTNGPHGPYWSTLNGKDTVKTYAKSNIPQTQAKRMVDIPKRVRKLNQSLKGYFTKQKSIWRYYELIDTQYPLDQNVKPADTSKNVLPQVVANKPGGDANLALLTNLSMETFFQKGNQPASSLIEGNAPNNIGIFGTESCMGCHSSAGVYIKGKLTNGYPPKSGQLTADFSWLLAQKAQWEEGKPKNNQ
ncbi:hypothetical protein [Aquimarina sp. 2201CG5-10]|uniref:hypothetical protein n=1 Tax=Aquimarina callyspongiae TaxID=3098150 RepID=UPI002AB504B3|nr:hypothetical protein [Aquimarina sp. 2201CG5-10]MDY8138147.1 hypothetical protein [Aquimarina sp. 2201CG5-10]